MGIPGAVDAIFFLFLQKNSAFIKNWKNGKVILDFELEKCTRDIFTLPRASMKRSGQSLNECDWIWLCGETCLEVCC